LKRVLVRELQDPLAEALLRGRFSDGDTVEVSTDGSGFSFEKA
jgi:ATP-dependent Clp protease ATP-binding subunit ClpB